jgi:peptidoglycan/xylan/chitin deacetylase (PgdA/CDA1 family)
LNPAVKHLAERALIVSGAAALARRRFRRRTLVLAYHNVLPDGAPLVGDRSLHLPRREFARQLDHLAESYDVVPIGALAEPVDEQGYAASGRPRVIITFDDAYAGALTAGLQELARRRMPATIFVAPGLLGTVPWWDILAEDSGGIIPAAARNHALDSLGGKAESILDAHPSRRHLSQDTHFPRIGMDVELARAAAQTGVTLGSHTWSHPNLRSLHASALELELTRSLEWLSGRFPSIALALSYPYGLFTSATETTAARCGYDCAFRIDGRWIPETPPSAYALPRLNIPSGLSLDGFRLRLAGL